MIAGTITQSSGKCVELKEKAGLFDCLLEHKVSETKATFKWTGPKISREMWNQILAYFKWTYDTEKSEAQVRLFVHPELGWMAWAFPQKGGTGMTTKEIEGEEFNKQRAEMIPAGYVAFGTVHHHCSSGAFQSGTDTWDEQNVDGLHITVGNMDKPNHTLDCRLYMKSNKFSPDMCVFWNIADDNVPHLMWLEALSYDINKMCNDIARKEMGVAPPADTVFPEKWKENYIVPTPVTYGMLNHQQQSGHLTHWQGNGGAKGETNGAESSKSETPNASPGSKNGSASEKDKFGMDAAQALADIMQYGWTNAITESRCKTCIEECRDDINSELKYEIMAICELHRVDIEEVYTEMVIRDTADRREAIADLTAEGMAGKVVTQDGHGWPSNELD